MTGLATPESSPKTTFLDPLRRRRCPSRYARRPAPHTLRSINPYRTAIDSAAGFHFSLAHFFGDCVVSAASVDQKNFRNGFDSGHTWSNVSPSYSTPPFIT